MRPGSGPRSTSRRPLARAFSPCLARRPTLLGIPRPRAGITLTMAQLLWSITTYAGESRDDARAHASPGGCHEKVPILDAWRRDRAGLRVRRRRPGQDDRAQALPLGAAQPSAAEGDGGVGGVDREGLERDDQIQG